MVDALVALVVASVPIVVTATDARVVGATLSIADIAASVIAVVLLMVRRRAPLIILAVSLFGAVWVSTADELNVLQVVVVIALYTVASTSSRTVAWSAAAATGLTLFIYSIITKATPWYDADNIQEVVWTVIATAVGDAVRSRRAYLAAMEERAERAERTREEEAQRQVVEERLRIARELHDIVAHHIAVINVQAGVAAHLLRDDPAGAGAALVHVRRGGQSVLDELATILNVLRQPDGGPQATQPLPTLDQLDELIGSFQAVGLHVEWHTTGARRLVPPALELAAYRIIEESLTNAHRYGRGPRVVLRVDYQPDALSIEVVNDIATRHDQTRGGSGHGLTGMRERVSATGGTFTADRTGDGRFRVRAVLPVETGAER